MSGDSMRFLSWPRAALRFGEVKVETVGGQHVFEAQVYLVDLDPAAVRVELYADGDSDGSPFHLEMTPGGQLPGAGGGYLYRASVPATRPATEYTPRVIPHRPGVAVPLEVATILWQRSCGLEGRLLPFLVNGSAHSSQSDPLKKHSEKELLVHETARSTLPKPLHRREIAWRRGSCVEEGGMICPSVRPLHGA
jgi:hypothetical protein